jgi:hypothetical protein
VNWESVYTVIDYFDGPRAGVANFCGKPHALCSVFDEAANDWAEDYLLKPLTRDEFETVMLDWAIWLRWLIAYRAGATTIDTHPSLPCDNAEHLELAPKVAAAMSIPEEGALRATARFAGKMAPDGEMHVLWTTQDLLV